MDKKETMIFIIVSLLSISFTYGMGSVIVSAYEYEVEKNIENETINQYVSEIKDGFIHDSIEEQVTKGTRQHIDFMGVTFN